MKAIEELVGLFSRLPGIGKKSAARMAFHILRADESYAQSLAASIAALKGRVLFCSICGGYAEEDPCPVCSDPGRDPSLLCVVEQPQDVLTIEAAREYRGRYHVLGGLIAPLDGVGPEALRLDSLLKRALAGEVREVIVATNPTVEGDITALYVQRLLSASGLQVTRLASGLPVGGDLEYADRLTLSRSFRGRQKMA